MPSSKSPPQLDLLSLTSCSDLDFREIAQDWGVTPSERSTRAEQIHQLVHQKMYPFELMSEGCLDLMEGGFGFLRSSTASFSPTSTDIYVSPSQVKRFKLKRGDSVRGLIRPPKDSERYYALLRVDEVNHASPEGSYTIRSYAELTPTLEKSPLKLSTCSDQISSQLVDIFCPLSFGDRILISGPPHSGKTTLLKEMAQAAQANHPDAQVIYLLVDGRPEEILSLNTLEVDEALSIRFDEASNRQVHLVDFALSRAKRLIERGDHVILALDSLHQLGRAHERASSHEKTPGHSPSQVVDELKQLIAAAGQFTEGGSLTLMMTSSIDTGWQLDELIYRELNEVMTCELSLSKRLWRQRIFPAVDLSRSIYRGKRTDLDEKSLTSIWQECDHMAGDHFITRTRQLHEQIAQSSTIQDVLDYLQSPSNG